MRTTSLKIYRYSPIYSFITGLIISLFSGGTKAQSVLNELTVDRPGIAETPFTVAPGTFQFETGFDYDNRPGGDVYFLPTMLLRTGLSKGAELRISARHVLDQTEENTVTCEFSDPFR